MARSYGQFCPVAKAMELLDERWTMLVIRELAVGSRHFNELRRGVPRMSPSLLSKRLRTLVRAGVVERREDDNRVTYELTPCGRELEPIVMALGRWGTRWIGELGEEDLDPHLVLWDVQRNVDPAALPRRRTVLRFTFTDVPQPNDTWWLVATADEVDVCEDDPGHPVAVTVECPLRTFTRVWRGDIGWDTALRGDLTLRGPAHLQRAVPAMLKLSVFADVPRPPVPA